MVCCMSARSDATTATGSGAVCARHNVSRRWCTAPADALPISYGIVSRSGNERTRSSPSQAASSARQRRARSSRGATTTTVLRETWTSDAHANARAPAVASAILVERPSSRRSARSRNRSLRSASARMPPRRAADPTAVVLAIELVHRSLDAVADRDLRGLGPADDHLVRVSALVRREWREHVLREVGDLDSGIHRGDADPQARKPLADLARDRAHPVVRSRSATREEFRQMDQAFSPFYLKDAEKGLHRKRRWGPADAYRSKDTREGPPTGPLAAMRVCRRGARDPGSGR